MADRIAGKINPDNFEIIHKPPPEKLAMRRIVYNNDFQAKDEARAGKHRWKFTKGRWAGDSVNMPKVFTHTAGAANEPVEWMTYHHLLRDSHINRGRQPANPPGFETREEKLIANMQGYNTGEGDRNQDITGEFWVGDLMLDCEVQITDAQGELLLELSRGIDRFQARFDLSNGKCKLVRRTGKVEETMTETVLAEKDTNLKKKGTFHVRFANFDEQLTVWVDSDLPFGEGQNYPPAKEIGPIGENVVMAPARVGVHGGSLSITHLQLWRDTYYTLKEPGIVGSINIAGSQQKIQTFYVQPGHYLALGDNSSASSDSRYWGLVPERLLLGRALWVYYPFGRFGGIE
jgi:signal peptidase I